MDSEEKAYGRIRVDWVFFGFSARIVVFLTDVLGLAWRGAVRKTVKESAQMEKRYDRSII
jgi:hypothetical protein